MIGLPGGGKNRVVPRTFRPIYNNIINEYSLLSGEPQSWSEPPPGLKLVQKTDPMARKPYVHCLQTVPLATLNPDKDNSRIEADRKSYGATAATEKAKGDEPETSDKKGISAT